MRNNTVRSYPGREGSASFRLQRRPASFQAGCERSTSGFEPRTHSSGHCCPTRRRIDGDQRRPMEAPNRNSGGDLERLSGARGIARLSNLKSPDDPMARHFNLPLTTCHRSLVCHLPLTTFPLLISCLISRPPIQNWHSNFPAHQSVPQGGINHKSAIQRPCHSTGRASSWSATGRGAFGFQ